MHDVISVGDTLSESEVACEDKKDLGLGIDLHEIDTISDIRATVLRLRIDNVINSLDMKHASYVKKSYS